MKAQEAELFDNSEDQISIMYDEIGLLSKKKPNDLINKFKLKFINDVLKKINKIMGEQYTPFDDFNTFDEDDLPTVSDVVFILSQYLKSMNKFRYDNTYEISGKYYWSIPGKRNGVGTKRPKLRF